MALIGAHQTSTFYILELRKPGTHKEHRETPDGWLRARVKITSGRFKDSTPIFEGKLPTCCTSFQFTTTLDEFKKGYVKPTDKKLRPKCELRDPNMVSREDLIHMITEMEGHVSRPQVDTLHDLVPAPTGVLKAHALFGELDMSFRCDFFRFQYESVLLRALPKQRERIRALDSADFKEVYTLLMEKPWLMCMAKYSKQFGLKEMALKDFYTHIRETKKRVHPMFCTVVRLYTYIEDLHKNGDSIFAFAEVVNGYMMHPKWRDSGDSRERLDEALTFLTFHGLEWVQDDDEEQTHLAFPADLFRARQTMAALDNLQGLAEFRGMDTPCVPHADLSETQKAFLRHCMTNKLTLLTGGPGTGKSECLVALMATFGRPMVVSYMGMMVYALQKRFGDRPETTHTIHSIYHTSQLDMKEFQTWLDQFDVIVIDECSNVDENLFAKLLNSVPAATKIVCAGDLGQIYPIKPGCPFRDLIRQFPQHTFELTENKRVDPDALALARASHAIITNQMDRIEWGGALKMDAYADERLQEVVLDYVKHGLENFQVVVLINKERKRLNRLIEDLLIEHNYIKRAKSHQLIKIYGEEGEMELFVGKKIAFCANVRVDPAKGESVRNGELGIITNIRVLKNRQYELILEDKKRVTLGNGAIPFDQIRAGYATTCNKAQGSEWLYTIFSIHRRPSTFFTAEFAYVAVSRAKRGCTVLGDKGDLYDMCSRRSAPRATLLNYFLSIRSLPGIESLEPYADIELPDYENMEILDPSIPAVPMRPDLNAKTRKNKRMRV